MARFARASFVLALLASPLVGVAAGPARPANAQDPSRKQIQVVDGAKPALENLLNSLQHMEIEFRTGRDVPVPDVFTGLDVIKQLASDSEEDRQKGVGQYSSGVATIKSFTRSVLNMPGLPDARLYVINENIKFAMGGEAFRLGTPVQVIIGGKAANGIDGQDVSDDLPRVPGAGTIKILVGGAGRSFKPEDKGSGNFDAMRGGNGGNVVGHAGPGQSVIGVGGDGGRGRDGSDSATRGAKGGVGGHGGDVDIEALPPQQSDSDFRVGIAIGGAGGDGGQGGNGEEEGENGENGGNAGQAKVRFDPKKKNVGIAMTQRAGNGGRGGHGGLFPDPSGTGGNGGKGGEVILAHAAAFVAVAVALDRSGTGGGGGDGKGREGVGGNGANGGKAGRTVAIGGPKQPEKERFKSVMISLAANSGDGGFGGNGPKKGGNGMNSENGGDAELDGEFISNTCKAQGGKPGALGPPGEFGGTPGNQGKAGFTEACVD